ncbi:hypothetical protein ACLOJK_010306 [Asimina triloba]
MQSPSCISVRALALLPSPIPLLCFLPETPAPAPSVFSQTKREAEMEMEAETAETEPKALPLPLNTRAVEPYAKYNRLHALLYATALLALFYHRSLHLGRSNDLISFALALAMLFSDTVLAFMWAATQSVRWRPVRRSALPENLSRLFDDRDLPALDVFICTADPRKEPPISVANTALSAMAFAYPTDKISVYVSDDGGSDLMLFAFTEAAKFARHWLPFCRENGIEDRCPEAYFTSKGCDPSSEKIKNSSLLGFPLIPGGCEKAGPPFRTGEEALQRPDALHNAYDFHLPKN